ncbi:hypothetical protein BHE74_00040446 [Ensete ventricosum]|nr:hypothetical protein BHE74_00040446 [Ensete ventricosum]
MVEILIVTARNKSVTIDFNCDRPLPRYQLSCGEGRSVEGEGRRRCSKKRENRENLDVKPFCNPDLVSSSLDDLDLGGNGEVAARVEAISFIASSATLRLLLCRVLH